MAEISSTGDQMLTVLEEVTSTGPSTATEISRATGMNRTVVHRLLNTLHGRSYLRRQPDGSYVVGPMVVRLAAQVEPALRAAAMPVIASLAELEGETVVIHSIDLDDAVVVEQALGTRHLVRVEHQVGSRHALASGASGRAILAFQPEKVIARIIAKASEPDELRTRLARAQELGYALSHDELQRGVHGVAAPVRNAEGIAHASVGIVVPAGRAVQIEDLADPLIKAAAAIEAALGAAS